MEIKLFCYYSIIIKILRGEAFNNHFFQAQECSTSMCNMLSEDDRSASMDKTLLTKLKETEEVKAEPAYSAKIKVLFEHARVGTGKLKPI